MNIQIREANAGEESIIAGFQIDMALETENMVLPPDRIKAGVRAVFDDPSKGTYYVCEADRKIAGSLLITQEWSDWRNSYIWWFQSVYIIPGMRRNGIFREMYNYIKDLASKSKIPGLRLYVDISNTAAQRTYESMGMNGDHYKLYESIDE